MEDRNFASVVHVNRNCRGITWMKVPAECWWYTGWAQRAVDRLEPGKEEGTAIMFPTLRPKWLLIFLFSSNTKLNMTYDWSSSGLKRWNQTLVPVVRARFEPRCGRPHFAPTRSGVRVCGRNRTEAREREWAEGTVSSLHVKRSDKILP